MFEFWIVVDWLFFVVKIWSVCFVFVVELIGIMLFVFLFIGVKVCVCVS